MKAATPAVLVLAVVSILAVSTAAQSPYPGNTLITPVRSTETFMIDIGLNTLQSWHGDNGAGHTVYWFTDGSVLRAQGDPTAPLRGGGGSGGHLQRIDATDTVIWDYFFSSLEHQQHHDIEPMPDGNVLVIAWEPRTAAEAIAAGRAEPFSDEMLPTLIAELEPVGSNDANIVWEWRIWDHLIQNTDPTKPNYGVIADHPGRVDINLRRGGSWAHANFISYNPQRDEILFSARGFNEVFVIDHSTTTAEAAGTTGGNSGRGGDLLYRWGNPQNYGRGTGADQVFFGVHGANWIHALLPGTGGILAFNNGNRPASEADSSSVVEIHPPMDENGRYFLAPGAAYGPAAPSWEYSDGRRFYSVRYGSGFRQPNGNTLICEGVEGNIFEVTPAGNKVWVYIEPVGRGVFAAQRYWGPITVASALDIYPGSCPNTLNITWLKQSHHGNGNENAKLKKGGVMPAALLGSDILDVTFVDASTLFLNGIAPLRSSLEDVARPAPADCDCNGDEPDGILDLTLKFSRQEVALALGVVHQGDEITLTLTGKLLDGTPFRANDCIVIENNERVRPHEEGPGTVALHAAVPNPFNPTTMIRYDVGATGPVSLVVYDVAGRRVATLVNEVRAPVEGGHAVTWNGHNDRGQTVPSGVYFYRLVTRDYIETRKMVLMK